MQAHRRLMLIGAMLLILTFVINTYNEDSLDDGFNFAYITGAAMIGVFLWSFYLFYSKNGRQ